MIRSSEKAEVELRVLKKLLAARSVNVSDSVLDFGSDCVIRTNAKFP